MSLNPVQIFNAGAEEEKAETARLVSDNYLIEAASPVSKKIVEIIFFSTEWLYPNRRV